MEFEREKQSLLLEGVRYTANDLHLLKTKVVGASDSSTGQMLYDFLQEWFTESPWMTVHTSGSTGKPKKIRISKDKMMQSARLTCEFLNLQIGDTALLCMNLRYIGAMMVVVRSLVAGLNLIIRPASGHPLADNTLQVPEEKERLRQTDVLIIGGGAIDEALEAEIRNLPGAIYSTYGMTETLSHIALRRLNGVLASERYYPFASVELSLSSENTLVIKAPLVCDDILQTNDIAHIYPDGSFTILGRKDNVINSGGIKIQAEEIEKILRPYIPVPFVITSVPDQRLGQAVTLLLEGQPDIEEIEDKLQSILEPYHRPKYVLYTDCIPQAGNGKMNRAGCRDLAERLLS